MRVTVVPPFSLESSEIVTQWRGAFENIEVDTLHAQCFRHPVSDYDWWGKLNRYSLGWVCTRHAEELVGFVNVAWDGGLHAFILDTMVSPVFQRHGVGSGLIKVAVERSKQAGCEWLHVDFEARLRRFYVEACGFRPTDSGLLPLT